MDRKFKRQSFYTLVEEFERKLIREALEQGGNIKNAGEILGFQRTTLSMRMKRLGLTVEFHKKKKKEEKLHERFRRSAKNVGRNASQAR